MDVVPFHAPIRRMSTLRRLKQILLGRPRMKLNYDVLERVMEFMGPWDILQMMQTCRYLRQVGIPILLRFIHIAGHPHTLEPEMCFDLYRWHLFRDMSRFSYVTYLIVPYGMVDDKPQYFTRLQYLDLRMGCEDINAAVYSWILSLTDLRGLKFREIGSYAVRILDVLAHLSPQLELLHLDQPRAQNTRVLDPLPALQAQPCADTLTGLLVESHDTRAGPRVPADGAPFRSVHTLVWRSAAPAPAARLVRAFPALRRLMIALAAPQDVRAVRRANAAAAPQRWAGLERVAGDLRTLWGLALRCAVGAVETALGAECGGATVGHLVGLMHDVAPRELAVTLCADHVRGLGRVLVFATLRRLDLTVRTQSPRDVLEEIRVLFESIEVSPLRHLRIGVTPESNALPSRSLLRTAHSARGHRVIQFMRTKMPNVEEITIDLSSQFKAITWRRRESDTQTPANHTSV